MTNRPEPDQPEPAEHQIQRLADFISTNIPGEPSRSEGAVDVAIRLLGYLYLRKDAAAAAVQAAVDEATAYPGRAVEAIPGSPDSDQVKGDR